MHKFSWNIPLWTPSPHKNVQKAQKDWALIYWIAISIWKSERTLTEGHCATLPINNPHNIPLKNINLIIQKCIFSLKYLLLVSDKRHTTLQPLVGTELHYIFWIRLFSIQGRQFNHNSLFIRLTIFHVRCICASKNFVFT